MAIDKNIFQMHNRYEELGPFERVSLERWRALNQDWSYRFITQGELDEYILDTWSEHADTYRQMQKIQKSQIMRAAIVYQNGGVYSDCDIYPIHKLNDFIPTDKPSAWFKLKDRADKRILIADYFFGAEKGHHVLNDIINESYERTVSRKHLIDNPDWGWAGYIYESSSIHAWSDIALVKHKEPMLEGGDNWIQDIEADPSKCHIYHYSVESWIPNNRFEREKKDPFSDEMHHLNAVKHFTGI